MFDAGVSPPGGAARVLDVRPHPPSCWRRRRCGLQNRVRWVRWVRSGRLQSCRCQRPVVVAII